MPITLPFPDDDDLGVDQSMAFETVTKLEPVDASVIEAGKKLATGIFLTKDIVNAPHNVLISLSLAETAKRIAEQSGGRIICEILDKEACDARCMGGFLGVARGSETPPQFIHLTYTPPSGKISKKVGVIGKGLLFDMGGYNIKTAMMELMKSALKHRVGRFSKVLYFLLST
ncbi:predicted protein [Phaeodactylum tricornutum CCAP 1055/1]|uniref:Cytosol aminopeptidase domain-containing protein n=1 Tax=Phaeodactylum tricornutum (strain CCAP 1055/1) TaxID=556484 RepID=B7G2H1_PHATC|nr:predicted protein [Phaeodactylum tricornutum CCAP 1055/1]EEC47132.1 predicted protein [Phaeodactylum tricornutum CCAP 1055/1]|eukprot:XP_002181209.1 predicted protein [Phaeodactylum tricornutum CCAP 1055/1]